MAELTNAIKVHGENVGRSLRRQFVEASRPSWDEVGLQFHLEMRPKRFTHAHATEAGYTPRTAKYTRQKFKKFGHTYPLVWSGEVRRLTATARITVRTGDGQLGNQGGAKVAYSGARKLNRYNPKSNVRMADEFKRVTDREADTLGKSWQSRFSSRFSRGS